MELGPHLQAAAAAADLYVVATRHQVLRATRLWLTTRPPHRAPRPPFPGPPKGRPVVGRWSFAGVSDVAVSVLQSLIYKAKPSRVWSSGEEKCGIHLSKRSGQLAGKGWSQHGGTNETVKSELRVMSCLSCPWHPFSSGLTIFGFKLRFLVFKGCGK